MSKIKQVFFIDDHEMECSYTAGRYGVTEIVEHAASGEGDKWFYDVVYGDGEVVRLFDFSKVILNK